MTDDTLGIVGNQAVILQALACIMDHLGLTAEAIAIQSQVNVVHGIIQNELERQGYAPDSPSR